MHGECMHTRGNGHISMGGPFTWKPWCSKQLAFRAAVCSSGPCVATVAERNGCFCAFGVEISPKRSLASALNAKKLVARNPNSMRRS